MNTIIILIFFFCEFINFNTLKKSLKLDWKKFKKKRIWILIDLINRWIEIQVVGVLGWRWGWGFDYGLGLRLELGLKSSGWSWGWNLCRGFKRFLGLMTDGDHWAWSWSWSWIWGWIVRLGLPLRLKVGLGFRINCILWNLWLIEVGVGRFRVGIRIGYHRVG